jgi:GNAT superfamily N-acetyltransferase
MTSEPEFTIRKMLGSDAADAASLSAELGYPVSITVMEERLRLFSNMGNHAVFAACIEDRVVGWIDVGIVYHLQSEPYGEIGGLIVSSGYQGCGIGRALVEKAEKWIASQRIVRVLVRSQIGREGAHAFYLRQNFCRTKTSAVFTKSLETP